MNKWFRGIAIVLLVALRFVPSAAASDAVVRVILFYSPACPHCHQVIEEDLPPLIDQYGVDPNVYYIPPSQDEEAVGPPLIAFMGESLELLYVNVLTPLGSELYIAAVESYGVSEERRVVPMMVVGENVLIGAVEIPRELPPIIENALAEEGIDWPDVPGLDEAIGLMVLAPIAEESATGENGNEGTGEEEIEPSEVIESEGVTPVTEMSTLDRIQLDPVGNSLSIVVLIGMIFAVVGVGGRLALSVREEESSTLSWAIPVLSVLGIAVAFYLAYVETSGATAVCGPVGDCNAVQQSTYAHLFGVIPVGVIGLAGYVGIILAWIVGNYSSEPTSDWAKIILLAMAALGTIFSIYLTFLEPFVIGASCAWCLSSAVIITIIMLLSSGPAKGAIDRMRAMRAS
ncbi:MAG: hypothetical protein GTO18_07865 [Anaerolineales bacterium]|nr:hypothetical protein [Anaerolineales bacterium]